MTVAEQTKITALDNGPYLVKGPMVVDAKVDPDICAEWLEEAFRGH